MIRFLFNFACHLLRATRMDKNAYRELPATLQRWWIRPDFRPGRRRLLRRPASLLESGARRLWRWYGRPAFSRPRDATSGSGSGLRRPRRRGSRCCRQSPWCRRARGWSRAWLKWKKNFNEENNWRHLITLQILREIIWLFFFNIVFFLPSVNIIQCKVIVWGGTKIK